MPHRISRTTTARAALAVGALAGALVLVPTVAQAAPAATHVTSVAHGPADPDTSLRRGDDCIWGSPGDIGAATDRAHRDDGSSTPPRIHC
jgi:hypothetical protein